MARPTREDAQLFVQLSQLYVTSGASAAMQWIWSDDFVADHEEFARRFPPGTAEYYRIGTLATFFETLGTLWKHELINEQLIFDWLGIDLMWERLEPLLAAQREHAGEDRLWENFQAMADASARPRLRR